MCTLRRQACRLLKDAAMRQLWAERKQNSEELLPGELPRNAGLSPNLSKGVPTLGYRLWLCCHG